MNVDWYINTVFKSNQISRGLKQISPQSLKLCGLNQSIFIFYRIIDFEATLINNMVRFKRRW